MAETTETEVVRCSRCGRRLAERQGQELVVVHRKRRTRFSGPGKATLDCPFCHRSNEVKMQSSRD